MIPMMMLAEILMKTVPIIITIITNIILRRKPPSHILFHGVSDTLPSASLVRRVTSTSSSRSALVKRPSSR